MNMRNRIAGREHATLLSWSPRRLLGIALSLAAFAAVSFAMLTGAQPTQAHNPGSSIHKGWGHGGVTASHYFVYACDDRRDGSGVYTEYIYESRPVILKKGTVRDVSSSGGCVQKRSPDGPITSYRVCPEGKWPVRSCSAWQDNP